MNHHNVIDSLLLTLLSIQALQGLFVIYLPNQEYSHVIRMSALLTMGIPHAALILYILYFTLKKTKILQCLSRNYQCLFNVVSWSQHSLKRDNISQDTDSLPDSGVARISVMVGHVNILGGEGGSGGIPPREITRAILESFPTVKLHYTITNWKYATCISRIRSIGLKLQACGKLLAQALDDCGRGVAYSQIDW